jgi:hypothetical protein
MTRPSDRLTHAHPPQETVTVLGFADPPENCDADEFYAYRDGYTAGFTAGTEIGAAGILLHIEDALGGMLPDLLPKLPYVGEYERLRRMREELPDEPCNRRCGKCSTCYLAKRRAQNRAQYGSPDFPGIAALTLRRIA